MNHTEKIAVLDAGAQYCHLIARRLRQIGVYAEIRACSTPSQELKQYKGIIISGGPASVYARNKPRIDKSIFSLSIPILGICYGHQFMAYSLGGKVRRGDVAEFGLAQLSLKSADSLFKDLATTESVWMSHRDLVTQVPEGFEIMAETDSCPVAAMADHEHRFYGVQFHPEVSHTRNGVTMLRAFALDVCQCKPDSWKPEQQINNILQDICEKAQDKNVFFLVSGGVDSSVAFMLCSKALGKSRVEGLYVDTGFMRKVDKEDIDYLIRHEGANIQIVDARQEFLALLARTSNPEQKRKKIGNTFVEVYERTLSQRFRGLADKWMLGQGTIYPDTIESGGTKHSSKIKTHHNRVSVICQLLQEGKVIEPLSQFYKDEVRQIALQLGLSERLASKHPFPGPGLAVRCLASRVDSLLEDHYVISEYSRAFGVQGAKLNLRTVGVKGDERSYQRIAVVAGNAEIADLEKLSTEITNHALDITRVVYLLTDNTLRLNEWQIKKTRITRERIELLREADDMVRRFLADHAPNLLRKIWQFPVILIPLVNTARNTESIVLRPVDSVDGMTASFTQLPKDMLMQLSRAIYETLRLEVLYDITNKPPATIEWE